MIGKTISHYRILEEVGKGGMGIVYKALDTRLQRVVALKTLPPEFAADETQKRRLMVEAQAASALNHPNICTIHEIDESDGTLFIVMEFIVGSTIADEISTGFMNPQRALRLAVQIAEALAKAHRMGIVHRDIKPSNILITEEEQIKILDFGLARVIKELDEKQVSAAATLEYSLSEFGQLIGTVRYMSPEQIRSEEVDQRSDIFSFGVLLYQMLTTETPFHGKTILELASAILKDDPPPVAQFNPSVPPAFDRIIQKALAKNREDRYSSTKEMLAELKRLWEQSQDEDLSVAILYFENLSRANEDEYFRDGMTEDVITELYKIKELKVFPRSAVLAYRDKPATAPEIGQQLGASYVLGGSLRRAGNRVRITAQLVETRSGHTVWAERYDRELKDIFDLQDDIARSLANALRITLSQQEERAIARKPTENLQAYDYYLRGRSLTRRFTKRDLELALRMFEHAITLEPKFALAHAGYANVCGLYYDWYDKDVSWVTKALAAADRALALRPQLPEALAAKARIFWSQNMHEEAILYSRQAVERKPDCEGAYWTLGQALFALDRLQEAADLTDRAVQSTGDDYNVFIPFHNALERLEQRENAKKLREKWIRVLKQQVEWVPDDVRARLFLASHYAREGKAAEAVQELESVLAVRSDDSNILYNAACSYAILSMKKDALALLKRAKQIGLPHLDWVAHDPDLNSLHDEPEFMELLQDSGN